MLTSCPRRYAGLSVKRYPRGVRPTAKSNPFRLLTVDIMCPSLTAKTRKSATPFNSSNDCCRIPSSPVIDSPNSSDPLLTKTLAPGTGLPVRMFCANRNSSLRDAFTIMSRSLTTTMVVASSFSLDTVTAVTPGPSIGSSMSSSVCRYSV